MRGARARPGRRHESRRLRLRRRRAVGHADRRALVAILQLEMLGDREPARRILLPVRGLAARHASPECWRSRGRSAWRSRRCAPRSAAARSRTNRAARSPPQPSSHGGELPAEIDRLFEAGMHADAAGRRAFVRGVAGDEDASVAVAARHEIAALPRQTPRGSRRRTAPPASLRSSAVRIGPAGGLVEHGEAPQLLAVDRDQLAPSSRSRRSRGRSAPSPCRAGPPSAPSERRG